MFECRRQTSILKENLASFLLSNDFLKVNFNQNSDDFIYNLTESIIEIGKIIFIDKKY